VALFVAISVTIKHGARRITIKSIGQSLPVTPLAYASVAPVPANPFCFAGGIGLKLCRSLERYTDEGTGNQLKGLHEFI
jgi:hypothetical protein